jgi:hypothetical protein
MAGKEYCPIRYNSLGRRINTCKLGLNDAQCSPDKAEECLRRIGGAGIGQVGKREGKVPRRGRDDEQIGRK